MSESDAFCPSFMTCVESLTLSWSESWFLVWSNFSTLPVTCWSLEADALLPLPRVPEDPIDPDELEPDPVPIEPDESDFFEGSDADDPDDPVPSEPDEPLEPEDVEPLELPLEPPAADCAPAGSAMRRPAIPRPVTIPLPIFM